MPGSPIALILDSAIIENQALQLPEGERALLADKLLSSLSHTPDDVKEAWIRESRERRDAYRRGEIEAVDGLGAVARLKESLAQGGSASSRQLCRS